MRPRPRGEEGGVHQMCGLASQARVAPTKNLYDPALIWGEGPNP
jgi:hypothetical protein